MEFGDVDGSDVEAAGFKAGAGAWERGGEDYCVREGERVGGVRFGRIDVNPFETSKRDGIEPVAIGEECVVADVCDGRFEMETTVDRDDDYFVVVGTEDGSELRDAFAVGAFGEADKKLFVDAEDVAAFHCARQSDVFEFAEFGESLGERRGFRAAGCCTKWHDDREFLEDDGWIFDKHGVGEIGFGGKRDETSA